MGGFLYFRARLPLISPPSPTQEEVGARRPDVRLPLIPPAPFSHKGRRGSWSVLMRLFPHPPCPLSPRAGERELSVIDALIRREEDGSYRCLRTTRLRTLHAIRLRTLHARHPRTQDVNITHPQRPSSADARSRARRVTAPRVASAAARLSSVHPDPCAPT